MPGSALADGSFAGRTRFDLDRAEIQRFVEATAAANKMEPLDVYRLLAKAEPQPKIIELISKPAEKVSPWWEYRERFLTEQRIAEGAQFMLEHRARLEKAHKDTGVAPEYVVAIIGVETFYGRITGKYRVLDALATLAFDYPPRAEYFRSELAQFIALSREEAVDPLTALGSYAGAMGAGQFMPSSYRRYAVDGSDDKQRNLFADWDDIIASVANYFKENGWVADGPVLAEAVLQPDAPVTADPGNLTLNETVAGLKAKGVDFDTGAGRKHAGAADSRGDAGRACLPRRLQEFRSDHALQPQRALRHGGARSRDHHRRSRRGDRACDAPDETKLAAQSRCRRPSAR